MLELRTVNQQKFALHSGNTPASQSHFPICSQRYDRQEFAGAHTFLELVVHKELS